MTWWDDLSGEVDATQLALTRQLLDLLPDLQAALQGGGNPASVAAEIERRTARGVAYTFSLAGRAQYEQLNPLGRDAALLQEAARVLGQRRGQLAAQRALAVLEGMTAAMVSPYARLAAQVLITDAARTGLRGGAIVGGATHKRFVRIRQAKEGRAHSVLEGVVKQVNEPYLIAGIAVHGPGDERLPWSERAWCGHALEYLRLEGQTHAIQGGEGNGKPGKATNLKAAIAIGKAEGFEVVRDGSRFSAGSTEVAFYDEATGKIYLNPSHKYWQDPGRFVQEQVGAWSSTDPMHVIHHEIGHGKHHRSFGASLVGLRNAPWQERERDIAASVSLRAKTAKTEFMAEVYAGLKAGMAFDTEVMKLYNDLGGPQ